MKISVLAAVCASFVGLASSASAIGVPVFDSFGPFADPTFGGSGINNPGLNIATTTITDGANTITLGLAATQRYSGNPAVTDDGAGTYSATAGRNTPPGSTTPGALWNFNYYVDVAGGGVLEDYNFSLTYDFGPAITPAAADLGTLTAPVLAILGGASDPLTDTRMEGSQNLKFGYLGDDVPGFIDAPTTAFSPFAGGLYSFELTAFDTGGVLGSTAINVDVAPVPLPASLSLLLAGLGGLIYMRRRRAV